MSDIAQLLGAARAGDRAAQSAIHAQVHERLHGLARGQQRGHRRVAETTSPMHEAYLKMALPSYLAVENRAHFFCRGGQRDAADRRRPRAQRDGARARQRRGGRRARC